MTKEQPTIHVGIDVSKDKLEVAIAGGGVRDDVLSLGTFENAPASIDRLLKKLSRRGAPVVNGGVKSGHWAAQNPATSGLCATHATWWRPVSRAPQIAGG